MTDWYLAGYERTPFPTGSGGASLGLQTSLGGFWSFENTSWTDDTGNGATLTGTGTPSSVSGIVGNAVSLNGSTDFLSCGSTANLLNGGSSFSVQAWVNISSGPGEWQIFNKDNVSFGQREWGLGTRFTSSNVYSFVLSNTSTTLFRADSTVTVAPGWKHIVGTYDSSSKAAVIYVNGSASGSGVTLTGTMNSSSSAPINVGRIVGTPIPVAALIDQCGFWKGRVLSSSDVAALYNLGAGLSYAAMA